MILISLRVKFKIDLPALRLEPHVEFAMDADDVAVAHDDLLEK